MFNWTSTLINFRNGLFTVFRFAPSAAIVLCCSFALSGCTKRYSTVTRELRETPSCCTSLADIPTHQIKIGETQTVDLGKGSPVFQFETGKSYFHAVALPEFSVPYEITIDSYLMGGYLKNSYLFAPRLVTLDKDRKIIRTSHPEMFSAAWSGMMEALKMAEGLEQKLSGKMTFDTSNREERYVVVLTTDTLLQEQTAVPVSRENTIWTLGGKNLARDLIDIPNSPAGKITVSAKRVQKAENQPASPIQPPSGQIGQKSQEAHNSVPKISTLSASSTSEKSPEKTAGIHVNPVIVATHSMNGTEFGTLELGRSSRSDAQQHFARVNIALGLERTGPAHVQIGTQQLQPMRMFLPTATPHQLYFDKNDKLILFVDNAPSDMPSNSTEFLQRFPTAWESKRTQGSFELQTALSRCVTLIASFRMVDDSLGSATYAYSCPTE